MLRMRHNQPDVLRNRTCCYCHVELNEATATKEHVVARRFVPKGSLDRSWNLILRACQRCNGEKSDLEDDLALISLQHYPFGSDAERDASVRECLAKATRAFSRRSRKPVSESHETSKLELPLGPGGTMSVEMISPPQLDDDRAFRLANLQATAFFYGLTYDEASATGRLWPDGGFFTVDVQPRSDWGNHVQLWFMNAVAEWRPRVIGSFANDFFRVAIRKHPDEYFWSCAFEWNQGFRILAFIGERGVAAKIGQTVPPLFTENDIVVRANNMITRYRNEVPLKSEDDRMFEINDTPP